MKRPLLGALILTLLLSAPPGIETAHATTAVARCRTAEGITVYTDKACSLFGAKAVPIPGPLLTRIAHDEARFGSESGNVNTDNIDTAIIAPARRPAAAGCARTPTQLAMDLRASLAMGDINRIAESYDWAGMSSRQANQTLGRLQQLIGTPVVDSHYFDAQVAMGDGTQGVLLASNAPGAGGGAGMLQLVMGDGGSRTATDFAVRRVMGCYFVRY